MVDFPESAIFIFFSFFKELCPSFMIEFYLILNGQYGQYLVELCHLNSFSLIHKTHSFTWISFVVFKYKHELEDFSHQVHQHQQSSVLSEHSEATKKSQVSLYIFLWQMDTRHISSGWWWSWPGCWLWCSPRPKPSSSGNKIK